MAEETTESANAQDETLRSRKRKAAKIVAGAVLAAIALSAGGFLLWASDFYPAQPEALAILQEDGVTDDGDCIELLADGGSDVAMVFYPGAKVQPEAYLPILNKLRDEGIDCYLAKMPLNMAIFDQNAAQRIMEKHPEVDEWFVGGHSMGGAMASSFASSHAEEVEGLVLLGAYVYGDYPPEDALTVYGTFNSNLEEDIDYDDNIVKIEGGNHAQFGNYGPQDGDPEATISAEEQQDQAVEAVVDFIARQRAQG